MLPPIKLTSDRLFFFSTYIAIVMYVLQEVTTDISYTTDILPFRSDIIYCLLVRCVIMGYI